jgi:hypothetical protein
MNVVGDLRNTKRTLTKHRYYAPASNTQRDIGTGRKDLPQQSHPLEAYIRDIESRK